MSSYKFGMFKQLLLAATVVSCMCGCRRSPVVTGSDRRISVAETIQITENSDAQETETRQTQSERVNQISVYVCGQVHQPGVYELPSDARVITAIEAAGGAYEDADLFYMNLADYVNDGEKIYVPSFEETVDVDRLIMNARQTAGSGTKESSSSSLVNLNTASKEELMTLPGIGESKAEAIIAYRESVGRIENSDELMNIPGIKEGVYSKFKDKVCVD